MCRIWLTACDLSFCRLKCHSPDPPPQNMANICFVFWE